MKGAPISSRDFIALRIRKYLPCDPLFFVIEEDETPKIHVHGIVALINKSPEDIYRALKKVVGDRRKVREKGQLIFFDTKAVDVPRPNWARHHGRRPDDQQHGPFGWAHYAIKDIENAPPLSAKALIHCSHRVTQKARQIHLACLSDPIKKAA